MTDKLDLFKELSKPFPAEDIEWRIQRSGIKNGNVWAMAIPYITNRAIQQRLDEVFGPLGWKNEQKQIEGGWLCGISVYCKDRGEWVTKWDGAENTKKRNNNDMDIIKGGLSSSMKRAAVHWGIGRYLYNLDATFADCYQNNTGKNRATAFDKQTNQKIYYSWNEPQLPAWALPEKKQPSQGQTHSDGKHDWRSRENNRQKEADRENNRNNIIVRLLEEKNFPVDQFLADFNLSSVNDIQLYQQQQMLNYISQISQPQPEQEAAPQAAEKVISPKEVNDICSALRFIGMDEQAFCQKANIRQLGQLPQSRYDGAMDWLFSLATEANQPDVVIEGEAVQDEIMSDEQIRDIRKGLKMANVGDYTFLKAMNVRIFQELKTSQLDQARDWIEARYKRYMDSLPEVNTESFRQPAAKTVINRKPCRRQRDREMFRAMASEESSRRAA